MPENGSIRNSLANDHAAPTSQHLELYKLYVDMADRISARRLTANSFFLTINTGIVAFSGYLSISSGNNLINGQQWIIALAGIVLCYMWYRLIRSYADLNKAKFAVIHEMEKDLPYKAFDAEWDAVGKGNDPKRYLPFTKIEKAVPWVFLTLHAVVLSRNIRWEDLLSLICTS